MDLTAWMEQWNMIPSPGSIVVCAVSGGRDSVCLLHYLHEMSQRCGFSVVAGHYNHHMRPTAQRDEDFVRELCRELQVPFYTDGCDVVAAALENGCGVEEMGRRLRYAFLDRLADRLGASHIATAHHMGDQAETVLLNLLRGTGPEGLGGIPPVRGRLMRPLLNTPREEIEAYLAERELGHVEDETNESLAFARNRLRRLVLPELEKINPALRNNVARTAAIVRRENDFLDELASGYLPQTGTRISCRQLMEAPEALRPRMVRILASRLESGKKDWTAGHIERILTLAKTPRGGMLSLPGGARAVCGDGLLELEVADGAVDGAVELTEGRSCWNGWTVSVSRVERFGTEEDGALYLTESLKGKWEVDTWRGGEGLELPNSRGKRSVKRLLTERGIPPQERKKIPCIRLDGELAAVHGVGTGRHYLPEDGGGAIKINFYKENM